MTFSHKKVLKSQMDFRTFFLIIRIASKNKRELKSRYAHLHLKTIIELFSTIVIQY